MFFFIWKFQLKQRTKGWVFWCFVLNYEEWSHKTRTISYKSNIADKHIYYSRALIRESLVFERYDKERPFKGRPCWKPLTDFFKQTQEFLRKEWLTWQLIEIRKITSFSLSSHATAIEYFKYENCNYDAVRHFKCKILSLGFNLMDWQKRQGELRPSSLLLTSVFNLHQSPLTLPSLIMILYIKQVVPL